MSSLTKRLRTLWRSLMGKFKAKTNLTIADGGKDSHRLVKKGEVFEVDEKYADEHLHEQGHVEEAEDHEPVTAEVKASARKLSKAEKKAADKKAKDDALSAKKADKKDKE